MRLSNGVDLVEISRIENAIERHGERFLKRIYTPDELAGCGSSTASLAGRFAAKEAVAKALGTGIGVVSWQEIEILRAATGQPYVLLYGAAAKLAEKVGLAQWSLSISHSHSYVVAFVVALGEA